MDYLVFLMNSFLNRNLWTGLIGFGLIITYCW